MSVSLFVNCPHWQEPNAEPEFPRRETKPSIFLGKEGVGGGEGVQLTLGH